MSNWVMRRLGVSATFLLLVLAFPAAAGATITGGCTGIGTSTSSSVDLTTETEWHVKKADSGGGAGQGPAAHAASVGAYALGIVVPIANGTSEPGETSGSVEGVSVQLFAVLGARFVVSGKADNGCAGQIKIIIDDQDPLYTVLGGGGLLLAVIGGLLVLRTMRGGKGLFKRLLDAIYGLVGGLGAALALEQFGYIDPTSVLGLLLVIVAGIFAFLTCGILGGGKKPPVVTEPVPPSTPVGGGTETYPSGGVGGGDAT
ncbi:MAG TPA: hypothetical protein VIF63_05345 [Candidatus Limnocylindrales bacterium]